MNGRGVRPRSNIGVDSHYATKTNAVETGEVLDAGMKSPSRADDSAALLGASRVAIACGPARYPEHPPFSPDCAWPEYPFEPSMISGEENAVYTAVRESLRCLGLDAQRYGSPEWNPLGVLIRPGDTVVLKPNFVRDFRESSPDHADCTITHGAVLRAVVDYAFIALGGTGRIIVADAPQNDANFSAIQRIAGLEVLREFYRVGKRFEVEVYDLRPERALKIAGVIVGHEKLAGDPAGYVRVDLGAHSAFMEIEPLCDLLYGSEYDRRELCRHHRDGVHEYLISKTVLGADVVISIPKLKTHKKVGLTVNLKNLVGINGNKNWLPHHREGTPAQGGDQFATDDFIHQIENRAVARFKALFPILGPLRTLLAGPIKSAGTRLFGDTNGGTIRSGNWHGNDTTWRMVLDLNRILFYADANGMLHDRPVRRHFCIVDGIVAGEGNGPLDSSPRPAGIVLAGGNPVAVDLVCARLMGFDYERLPMLRRALEPHALPLTAFTFEDVVVRSPDSIHGQHLDGFDGPCLNFRPHFGWRGHIEICASGDPQTARGVGPANASGN